MLKTYPLTHVSRAKAKWEGFNVDRVPSLFNSACS